MLKVMNTHHYKNPVNIKQLRNFYGVPGTALATDANGLIFENAANNQLAIPPNILSPYSLSYMTNYTIEATININNTNRANANANIFGMGKAGDTSNMFHLLLGTGVLQLRIFDKDGLQKRFTIGSQLASGNHHIQVSYNKDTNSAVAYIDGASATVTPSLTGTGAVTVETGQNWWIGAGTFAGAADTTTRYAGAIKCLYFSNFARSAADMARRVSIVGKEFPIDKYTSFAWDFRNGYKLLMGNSLVSRKYV
jgi:hypothetical protein